MNWKDELVKKINSLSPEDYTEHSPFYVGIAVVDVSLDWSQTATIIDATYKLNSQPIGRVAPGFVLCLGYRAVQEGETSTAFFQVSRDLGFNSIKKVYDEVDFMSL